MVDRPRSTMGTGATDPAARTQERVEDLAGQAKHQAKDLADQAQQQAKSALSTRKDQAAAELHSMADAFRQTGNQLRDQDNQMVAQYTNRLADQVEQMSTYLENKDVDQMIADAENFARRRPELFIGGALALGFLAARFLKSSNERQMTGEWTGSQWHRYPGTEPMRHVTRDNVESNW